MSYLDNLYSPPIEIVNEDITVSKKYKGFGDMLKHYAKRIAAGAAVAGLAGYGLYRAGQDGKNFANNKFNSAKTAIRNKFKLKEEALNPDYWW